MDINIIINGDVNLLPKYETEFSSGVDVKANIENAIHLDPLERVLVPTGLFVEIPVGYEAQIRSRSGLALKQGLICLNSPGTIDSDYRGEIKVILINMSNEIVEINPYDRIAQMVFAPIVKANIILVENLTETKRADGGFGHTGV